MRYIDVAHQYSANGWNPLPLAPRTKSPVPTGYTGHEGADVGESDIDGWADTWPHWNREHKAVEHLPSENIGLRMPATVIGIDVDNYGSKNGHVNLLALEAHLGALPPTWASTSRDDGVSGIHFYRIPAGVEFPGQPCGDVEFIQRHHRYAVVWPSEHPEGRKYEWFDPEGYLSDRPPHVDELTELPDEWVHADYEAMKRPAAVASCISTDAFMAATNWSSDHTTAVERVVDKYHRDAGGGRHDAMLKAVAGLIRLRSEGHDIDRALADVRSAFIGSVTSDSTRMLRTQQGAEDEFEDALTGAEGLVRSTPATRPHLDDLRHQRVALGSAAVAADPSFGHLPASFWTARPVLEHIRQAAWSRGRSPDAVLGAVLARVAALTPPQVAIPAVVGSSATLATYVALVAPSGVGKSTSKTIGCELIRTIDDEVADDLSLGSGEGLVEAYFTMTEEPTDNGKGTKRVKRKTRRGVFLYLDEGQALAELGGRKGSTLLENLRSAWRGETIGQANASVETNRRLGAGSYTLGLVVGFQPAMASALLGDSTGGTPQRFLWFKATNPAIPDKASPWPGALDWEPPRVGSYGGIHMPMTLSLDDTIIDTIVREDRQRNRGQQASDDLDGHANLARLKVAGLLAVLDGGRVDVNLDDWSLAGTITRTSREVRTELLELVRIEERKREEASTSKHVRREAAVVDSHVNRAVEHMAASIARHVHKQACEGGCVKRCVSRSTASAHRQLATVDDAIEHAVSLRWITSVDEHFRPGEARPS